KRIEDETQKLPVAPRPAVLARGIDGITGGIILDQFNIGDQRGARERAFDEVMAEDGVLVEAVLERGFKSIDVIEALAGKSAVAEDILIEIGNREDVRVEPPVGRE